MPTHLDTLKAACRAAKLQTDSQLIAEGESVWLAGLPCHAEAGCIALRTDSGLSVVVNEASVLEVEQDEGRYLVRVKAGEPAVVRYEAVTTIREQACNCEQVKGPTVAENRLGGAGLFGLVCRVVMICWVVAGRRICVPYLDCRSAVPTVEA